jgi:hypothetical protein
MLVWVSFPHVTADGNILHHDTCLNQQSTETSQSVLLNVPAKSDTRVELPGQGFVPESSETKFLVLARSECRARVFTSFIVSHHIYTQVTSSYL